MSTNTYHRKEVLQSIFKKVKEAGIANVFVTNRPAASTVQMDTFAVVRMGSIIPYSRIEHFTDFTISIFAKDSTVEKTNILESLTDNVMSLFPLREPGLYRCNNEPLLLACKADDIGYHSIIISFRLIIKK